MVADYFTKPLQGSLFRKFRDFIMNGEPSSIERHREACLEDRRSVLEQAPIPNERLEGQTWTVVGHERDKRRRHKTLRKDM